MTIDMSEPSLPVAYIDIDGSRVNEMHGYLTRMNASTIRDSITPVGDDRAVRFVIDKYDCQISGLSVEVRNKDCSRLIEDTRIIDYSDYTSTLEASINLKDLIEENEEYNLILVLNLSDGRTAYYYTRIVQNENVRLGVGGKILFVTDFCVKTFDKENIKELSTFMESNSDGDNTSLAKVDIHSSMNQLTWAELSPELEEKPHVTIEEMGRTMATIRLEYMVSSVENRDIHMYRVVEHYRIRVTNQRTYLLSFNRTMDEILEVDKDSFTGDKLMLGIQSENVQMMESEDGAILVFENDGRLYCYNATDNKFIRLFAFYDSPKDDYRSRRRDSEVKILDVEENGNITYIAYGYMNRGNHEGEVGAQLYYYNYVLNTIEEKAFIPYYGSEEVLKRDCDKLSYINTAGDMFIFIDGTVYRIVPATKEYKVIAKDINEDTFFVSQSGKTIVWQTKDEGDANGISSNLSVMNLGAESVNEINKSASEYVKPIGFMNEDLIYGMSNSGDLIYNTLGDITFPLNRIIIQSESGKVLKEYHNDDIYVTAGSVEGNQITLKRVHKDPESGEIREIEDDHITNNTEVTPGKNTVAMAVTSTYEKITQLQFKSIVDIKSLKFLTPKEVIFEGGRNIALRGLGEKSRFLVYGNGEVETVYDDPARAIAEAYALRGTVIDTLGNEIYKRGETSARNQIMAITEESVTETKDSLTVCLDTMLRYQGISRNTEYMLGNGMTVHEILAGNLSNAYVLNLTGCTMDMMLYYVNKDIPVLALLNDGSAVLIIGFNEQNIVLFDPTEGTIYKKGMNDSREMFEENGNRFMTYALKSDI